MESYSLAFEYDHWMLRKHPSNQQISVFASKEQALHESLSLVHSLGATLVLTPGGSQRPAANRRP